MSQYNDDILAKIRTALVDNDIPEHMHEGVIRYVQHGIRPGGFMCAVLSNDLYGAASRADLENQGHLYGWARLLDSIPKFLHGSHDAIRECVAFGGLAGLEAKAVQRSNDL